ncbi:LysR family transcriptional regulator [Paenibacillus puldeungensis]|uniref:LysR family transcriptional regulator n=1 Tax=Paenibacillus puldeungensis TaxID=696536 RepID=A0ABW3S2J9_9BACL
MNLHALRLFYTIARTRSVTQASEQLRISQPAITVQVKKLEKELGIRLLRPLGRGITLTDAGEEIARMAHRLFGLEQQIERFCGRVQEGEIGQISLAATYLPAHILLPNWLSRFKKQYEEVELVIHTTNSKEALRLLTEMEVDAAIYGGVPERMPEGVQMEELFRDELWFVVAPGHPYANQHISLVTMMQEPFVMREVGSSTRERLLSLCRTHNLPAPRIALQFNGLHEAIQAVIAGYGANFVSSLIVRDEVQRGRLCRVYVDEVELFNTIAVWTRAEDPLPMGARNFLEMIRSFKPYG